VPFFVDASHASNFFAHNRSLTAMGPRFYAPRNIDSVNFHLARARQTKQFSDRPDIASGSSPLL
jgi:hypothetical protein